MLQTKLADQQDKLEKLCDDNDLQYGFKTDDFPIIVTIRPHWKKAAQQRIDFGEQEPTTDPNARIELVFGHELILRSYGDFVIDDDLLNKIKNSAKKLHYTFLQLYFLHQMEKAKSIWQTGRYKADEPDDKSEDQQATTESGVKIDKETGDVIYSEEESA